MPGEADNQEHRDLIGVWVVVSLPIQQITRTLVHDLLIGIVFQPNESSMTSSPTLGYRFSEKRKTSQLIVFLQLVDKVNIPMILPEYGRDCAFWCLYGRTGARTKVSRYLSTTASTDDGKMGGVELYCSDIRS